MGYNSSIIRDYKNRRGGSFRNESQRIVRYGKSFRRGRDNFKIITDNFILIII